MESWDMELILTDNSAIVSEIVEKTIQNVYLHYYPSGAVQFFLDLHSEARIEEAMSYEEIYLVVVQGNVIGTGIIRKNEICRLFILPEYQGNGYGSRLMDLLEARIFKNYPKVHVDASFPAESMYLKRGYQIISYEKIETENGDLYEKVWKEAAGLRKSGKLLERFGRISCPLVLIQGAVDPHLPEGVIWPLRDRNVEIKSYVLDKCGHTPWREKYAREEFARVLFSELEG
ncbi:MAG: GNAT family N-acetyltransferase [Eubacteriales bacterium]|nr:GNAT family N-acetyltransferase [Eubacteriales bacterium]